MRYFCTFTFCSFGTFKEVGQRSLNQINHTNIHKIAKEIIIQTQLWHDGKYSQHNNILMTQSGKMFSDQEIFPVEHNAYYPNNNM